LPKLIETRSTPLPILPGGSVFALYLTLSHAA
jgi:hypothetical protein